MAALHKALHIQRVVIVTPSVYGTDNSATLYGMKARGADARGVAVIDDTDAGERARRDGPRRACAASGSIWRPAASTTRPSAASGFRRAVERMQRRSWHVQMDTNLAMIAAIKDVVAASPVPVVFDHFGGAQAAARTASSPASPNWWSWCGRERPTSRSRAPIACRSTRPDYADVVPLAQALIAANPDRIVWGTDWPHPNSVTPPGRKPTDVTPLLQIDDGRLLNQLPVWAPDPADPQEDPGGQSGAALRVLRLRI